MLYFAISQFSLGIMFSGIGIVQSAQLLATCQKTRCSIPGEGNNKLFSSAKVLTISGAPRLLSFGTGGGGGALSP
jgi:hypothetical protein